METNVRKLATIRRIDDIRPIPDADAIVCAVVGGWTVVVRKDEFQVGDLAIYLEIDSWVPTELAPFLSKGKEPRVYEEVKGERLRTVRLRGQLSQGLLLPMTTMFDWDDYEKLWMYKEHPLTTSTITSEGAIHDPVKGDGYEWNVDISVVYAEAGDDLTELMGIKKWEPFIPAELAGNVAGPFPSYIPKTDQERIQNLSSEFYKEWTLTRLRWEKTEKLDGSSVTVFLDTEGKFGVCSRNWELLETESNSIWKIARELDLETKLREVGAYALQGELIGPGLQGNRYKLTKPEFRLYDIYDIANQAYLDAYSRTAMAIAMKLDRVPALGTRIFTAEDSIDQLLLDAEAKSELNKEAEREGVVYKCIDDARLSFKVISNKFLLKGGD